MEYRSVVILIPVFPFRKTWSFVWRGAILLAILFFGQASARLISDTDGFGFAIGAVSGMVYLAALNAMKWPKASD